MSELARSCAVEESVNFRRAATVFATLTGTALLAAACSGGGGGGTTVSAKKGGFAFDPASLTIKANTPTTITLKNPDAVRHDWVIADKNIKIVADPGKEGTGSVNLPAGTYKVVCTEPGHEAAGMVGQLVVS